MKKLNYLALFIVAVFMLCSCNSCSKSDNPIEQPEVEIPVDTVPETGEPVDTVPSTEEPVDTVPVAIASFAKGADVGWVTEM